ncbi:hypothetical protein RN001_007880 [Aquatica leii]|uniref:Uncharacterized protein n=1 Tax=Aquatica leii TaxID=1421715 RepID=A0AAN7SH09_9COLE|nr:hypothetical protein RN001_007880 [Aquatica leii]
MKNIPTPDEQSDIDFDKENNESTNCASKSPCKLSNNIKKSKLAERETIEENTVESATFKNETAVALTNSCEEVTEITKAPNILPPPNEFGGGNPFLMFLCISVLLQHRNQIISKNSSAEVEFDGEGLQDQDSSDDELCVICGEYEKSRETWFRCTSCGKWAQKDCSGVDKPLV